MKREGSRSQPRSNHPFQRLVPPGEGQQRCWLRLRDLEIISLCVWTRDKPVSYPETNHLCTLGFQAPIPPLFASLVSNTSFLGDGFL